MTEPMSDGDLEGIEDEITLYQTRNRVQGDHLVLVMLPTVMDEVRRLRAQNAAMREIVRAVTEQVHRGHGYVRDAVLCYNDNSGELECPFCNGSEYSEDRLKARFEHEADCPVTKARTLVQQWQEAETSERNEREVSE